MGKVNFNSDNKAARLFIFIFSILSILLLLYTQANKANLKAFFYPPHFLYAGIDRKFWPDITLDEFLELRFKVYNNIFAFDSSDIMFDGLIFIRKSTDADEKIPSSCIDDRANYSLQLVSLVNSKSFLSHF